MKKLFLIVCLLGFLGFCLESADFATALKQLHSNKIETALNQQ